MLQTIALCCAVIAQISMRSTSVPAREPAIDPTIVASLWSPLIGPVSMAPPHVLRAIVDSTAGASRKE
jgi:hypothetical protein